MAYRSSVTYRNTTTYPGGAAPAPATVTQPVTSGVMAVVQTPPKSQVRRYVFPYWEVEEERAREQEREIAREKEIEAAEVAQAEAEAAAPEPEPVIDEAQLQTLADSLTAAALESVATKRPVAQEQPVAAGPTYPVPDDLFFRPIIPAKPIEPPPFNDDAEIMEALAIIEAIEAMEHQGCC